MRGNTRIGLGLSCFLMVFTIVTMCGFSIVQDVTIPVLQSISPDTARIGVYVSLIGNGFGST